MKNILPVIAFAAAAVVFAAPAMACERHQSHEAMNTVEAVPAPTVVTPAPTVVIEPAAQSAPGSEIKAESAISLPLGAAYENCRRKNTTVYLTQ